MLLRRITEHVKEQNWFAVGLDFCIVVAGILIAFQITNWSEARSARQLEREYMVLLARDIATIETALRQQVVQDQHIATNAKKALKKINDRRSGMDPLDIGQSLTSIFGRRTLDLQSPTYSEMMSVGRLTLIQDTTLRNRIISYFDEMQRLERVAEQNNEFFVEKFTAFLRDSGLGYVPLPTADCPPSLSYAACGSSDLISSVFGSEQTHSASEVLGVDLDDPLWAKVRSHIVWRGVIAGASVAFSKQALEDTQSLVTYLEAAQ
ncbi:MAG: hypothetical protein ABJ084_03820 [Halioglobus sp.]